jgi:hypothetical protein
VRYNPTNLKRKRSLFLVSRSSFISESMLLFMFCFHWNNITITAEVHIDLCTGSSNEQYFSESFRSLKILKICF